MIWIALAVVVLIGAGIAMGHKKAIELLEERIEALESEIDADTEIDSD